MNKNYTSFFKYLIIIGFIFGTAVSANAQLRFGIKGGFDVVSNHVNKDILNASNRLGFQIGGTLEFMAPIVGLGGELSILYGHQEFNIKGSKIEGNNKKYSYSDYNFLRVPLNLKKRFGIIGPVGVFIQGGPYLEFKLSGGNVSIDDAVDDYKTKSFGAGLNVGAGVTLLKNIELGMQYRKLLTEDYSDNTGLGNILKKRPDNWSVGLTYFF